VCIILNMRGGLFCKRWGGAITNGVTVGGAYYDGGCGYGVNDVV